jgi:hypothetical protein
MPLMEPRVIALTDQHERPLDAAALAAKHRLNAANALLADVTSLVSRLCARRSGPVSAQRITENMVQEWEAPDAAG